MEKTTPDSKNQALRKKIDDTLSNCDLKHHLLDLIDVCTSSDPLDLCGHLLETISIYLTKQQLERLDNKSDISNMVEAKAVQDHILAHLKNL